ncbi:hypothetical protein [Streptomyces sp. NPDC048425]|uniref:hypothetical protein n=1 Tax=Streptomyces sp. NPDC048425 TaxID=3365548 RepID=UPI0037224CAE
MRRAEGERLVDVRRVPAVVRGSGRHRLALCAAGLAVLLAAAVLAALTEQTVEGGVRRRPVADPAAVVGVSGSYRAAGGGELDREVRSALDRACARVSHRTWSVLRAVGPLHRTARRRGRRAPARP